jgi:hypothetical protein
VGKSLKDNDTSEPSMKKVEGIEGDVEPVDEEVVASCHDKKGDLGGGQYQSHDIKFLSIHNLPY